MSAQPETIHAHCMQCGAELGGGAFCMACGAATPTAGPAERAMARRNRLDALVAEAVKNGWRVESRSETQAVIVRGSNPNHVLHLILTLVTFGLWAVIWIAMSIGGGMEREVLSA